MAVSSAMATCLIAWIKFLPNKSYSSIPYTTDKRMKCKRDEEHLTAVLTKAPNLETWKHGCYTYDHLLPNILMKKIVSNCKTEKD